MVKIWFDLMVKRKRANAGPGGADARRRRRAGARRRGVGYEERSGGGGRGGEVGENRCDCGKLVKHGSMIQRGQMVKYDAVLFDQCGGPTLVKQGPTGH